MVKLCPPRVAMKMPKATAVEENTPMTVSLDMWALRCTSVHSRANTTANTTAHGVGASAPASVPTAMPVNALCPSASEKKLILLVTTMVESRPNRGVMTSTARKAFFINSSPSACAQVNGRRLSREYQSSIILPSIPVPGGMLHEMRRN